jgi:hypothetical protein
MYFFLQSLNFKRLLPAFVFKGRISAGCLRFNITAGQQKSTRRPVQLMSWPCQLCYRHLRQVGILIYSEISNRSSIFTQKKADKLKKVKLESKLSLIDKT